jgi:hypothetical protein
MTETRKTFQSEGDAIVTAEACNGSVIELAIETDAEALYAELSISTARELLAHLAVQIAMAETGIGLQA